MVVFAINLWIILCLLSIGSTIDSAESPDGAQRVHPELDWQKLLDDSLARCQLAPATLERHWGDP
jgi:hypothetical protein